MMNYYRREDGTICKAIQFMGGSEEIKEHLFEVMDILAKANLRPIYRAEEVTDDWRENEAGDDYEQVVLPEHIFLQAGNDELHVGGYVLERDGDIYVMAGELFEAIWTWTPSDDMHEWYWYMQRPLPYSKTVGYWENKKDKDCVSSDGGVTFFRLSERPRYQSHGPIYQSAKTAGNKVPEGVMIADVCKHCGRSVVNFNEAGEVFKGFKHTEGRQRGLIRCWPDDTGQPYGLDATPRSYNV